MLNKLLVSIWFGVVMITSFVMSRELIIIAVTSSIYAIPLFIKLMKEEEQC